MAQEEIPGQTDDTTPRLQPRELAMSAAWHGGLARELTSVDGRRITVVFHGNWSHGFGPDFQDAMFEIGGAGLVTGSVEIHNRAGDWYKHGHHLDPRYNDVALHVVSRLDSTETRTADGRLVPIVLLDVPTETLFAIDARLPAMWETLGRSVCAPELALRDPALVRSAFRRLGDLRLDSRTRRFEGELAVNTPTAVLTAGVLDAFGYSENRAGMAAVAERWNRHRPAPSPSGLAWTTAWLLGAAGFLPLSPGDMIFTGFNEDQRVEVERHWSTIAPGLGEPPLKPTIWSRARTRPANHPVARLVSAAALLHATGHDPFLLMLDLIRDRADPVNRLRTWAKSPYGPVLGRSRVIAVLANVIVPFALALANHNGDTVLEETAMRIWSKLPAGEWSRPAKRALRQATGLGTMARLGERGRQGLLQLDRELCTPRRCFECPIAAELIRDAQRTR